MSKETKRLIADLLIALALAASAALFFAFSSADYVHHGVSARLTALWSGYDVSALKPYPVMAMFAKGFIADIGWVSGAIAVFFLYVVFVRFLRRRIGQDDFAGEAIAATRIGGIFAAVVFACTPAVREAATRVEPRLFDFTWALLTFGFIIAYAHLPRYAAWLFVVLGAVAAGCGVADSPLSLAMLPLMIMAVWDVASTRLRRPYGVVGAFLMIYIVALFIYTPSAVGSTAEYLPAMKAMVAGYFEGRWLLVLVFSTVPFLVAVFACSAAFRRQRDLAARLLHLALTFVAILAVATPLSPSALMETIGVLPVATSSFVALTAGYLAAYWWVQIKAQSPAEETLREEGDVAGSAASRGRLLGFAAGGILLAFVAVASLLNVFAFDRDSGRFAAEIARRIVDEMGERTWLVTDGSLDDDLILAARRAGGRELNLISLARDNDKAYIERLRELVIEKGVGGERNSELVLSLSLGILPFVQDWFSTDADIASQAAVFGAPDLWYSARVTPVPEMLLFGADPERKADWSRWMEFEELLSAPKGWGSYLLSHQTNPAERRRLELRRYMGLVANNRAVWLQDRGQNDEAFELYDLVLETIDRDNICALINELEMARTCYPKALNKKRELEDRFKAIVDNKNRRYSLWRLGTYYGYIRTPEMFIRMGYNWARSGRPGEALEQVRRAIDFVQTDNRYALLNMMAALYAAEDERGKSRETYEEVLSQDADNHDALIGMMRLELLEGDSAKAAEYLERATKVNGDDPRGTMEMAMLHLMRNNLAEAKKTVRKLTDANHGDMQAWSMLAMITIQEIDAAKDEAAAKKLSLELKNEILATMEKQARSPTDYYLQTTRAFVLLREGAEKRRAARDAFVAAARERPNIEAASDMVLGLDISLDDKEQAEIHAREVLRRNRKAPLANYVMGSLALQRGQFAEAEAFLRRSVAARKPPVLALNDLAEVLRRRKSFAEAELNARKAVESDPRLYVAWETLGAILLDAKGDLDEAEKCVLKAVELSKGKDGKEADVRMLVSLARVQLARGDTMRGKTTLRKVQSRIKELSDYERDEFEELRKSAR